MIELSKATAKLRDEAANIKTQITELSPQIESGLRDTETDVDKLSAKIGTLQTKRDILKNRLEVTKDKTFAALLGDVRIQHAAAKTEAEKLDRVYRDEFKTFKQTARITLPRITAASITENRRAWPRELQDHYRAMTKARETYSTIERILLSIDNDFRSATMGSAAPLDGKTAKILSRDVLMQNAAAIIPELA